MSVIIAMHPNGQLGINIVLWAAVIVFIIVALFFLGVIPFPSPAASHQQSAVNVIQLGAAKANAQTLQFSLQNMKALSVTPLHFIISIDGQNYSNVACQKATIAPLGTTQCQVSGNFSGKTSISVFLKVFFTINSTGSTYNSTASLIVPVQQSSIQSLQNNTSTVFTAFMESGLPASTQWTMVFNGQFNTSLGNQINFISSPGNYTFNISSIQVGNCVYYASLSSGKIAAGLVNYVSFSSQCSSSGSGNTTVTTAFTESGLPSGLSWRVTFASVINSSKTNAITFSTSAGLYQYSVSSSSNSTLNCTTTYSPFPSGGNINAGTTNSITFSASNACNLVITTFTESGLASNAKWAVTYDNINNDTYTSTSNKITFSTIKGTFAYSVPSVSNSSASCTTTYTPLPASGNLQAGLTQTVAFTSSTLCSGVYGIVYSVPITVANLQDSPTPSPFQANVTIDSAAYSSYEASNLQNIEFFYSNGTIIPSWLESGNSNTATKTIYWLRINGGIPANTAIAVYIGFGSLTTNFLSTRATGEAPQLSSVYGEYDNGANVFNFYDNFAGTAINTNKWTSTGSITNTAISTIKVTYAPQDITYDSMNGNVYVSNSYPYNVNPLFDIVSVINSSSNNVIKNISVNGEPLGIAYNPVNHCIYVGLASDSPSVSVISTITNTIIKNITGIGLQPSGIAYDPANGDMYVVKGLSNNVAIIDSSTNTVIKTINVSNGPSGVAYNPANNDIYVADSAANTISVISSSSNTVIKNITAVSEPKELTYDPVNKDMYVSNAYTNTVGVINSSNRVIKNITLGTFKAGSLLGITYDSANGAVYVANMYANTTMIINTTSNLLVSSVKVGVEPSGVAYNNVSGNVYVANTGSNTVSVIPSSQIHVNNGLTVLPAGIGTNVPPIYSNSVFANGIIDFYGKIPAGACGSLGNPGCPLKKYIYAFAGVASPSNPNSNMSGIGEFSGVYGIRISNLSKKFGDQAIAIPGFVPGTNQVYSMDLPYTSYPSLPGISVQVNYGSVLMNSTLGRLPTLPQPIMITNQNSTNISIGPIDWIRFRAYPPNGIAPTIVVGAIKTAAVTTFVESGLPQRLISGLNSTLLNWSITYGGITKMPVSHDLCFSGHCSVWYLEEINFSTLSGAFSYSASIPYNSSNGCTTFYSPNPSSGSAATGNVQTITFSGVTSCNQVFVTYSNGVSIINGSSNKVIRNITALPKSPSFLAVTPNGKELYVGSSADSGSGIVSSVSVTNLSSYKVIKNISVASNMQGLAVTPNGKYVYISNSNNDSVQIISTSTNSVVAAISVPCSPQNIAITPNGRYAYVINCIGSDGSNVSIIDTASNTIIKSTGNLSALVGEPFYPTGITMTPNGKYAYISTESQYIPILNASSGAFLGYINTSIGNFGTCDANSMVITPDSRYGYVTCGPETVAKINLSTGTFIKNITVGDPQGPMAISQNGKYIYVTSYSPNLISVIATSTDSVVSTINLGAAPEYIAAGFRP